MLPDFVTPFPRITRTALLLSVFGGNPSFGSPKLSARRGKSNVAALEFLAAPKSAGEQRKPAHPF